MSTIAGKVECLDCSAALPVSAATSGEPCPACGSMRRARPARPGVAAGAGPAPRPLPRPRSVGHHGAAMEPNALFYGDNLDILRKYIADASVDLIYLDPPFNSNATYNVLFKDESGNNTDAQLVAFDDTWHWGPDAESKYLYLTNTAYHQGTVPSPVSDLIGAFHSGIKPRPMLAYLAVRSRAVDESGRRFWANTMTAAEPRKNPARVFRGHEMLPPPGTHWRFLQPEIDRLECEGGIYYSKSGMPYVKSYLDERKGRPAQNLWTDIVMSKSGAERLGYPTQKPLALLERIIEASSNPGDVVLDPSCGCGTALGAAQK